MFTFKILLKIIKEVLTYKKIAKGKLKEKKELRKRSKKFNNKIT